MMLLNGMVKMNSRSMLPPTYLYLSIGAMILLHFMLPVVTVIHQPWNLLGIIPFVVGLGLNLVGNSTFKKCKTTIKPFEESTTLVTRGVFQISRNPMYLGFVLILSGIAIFMGSLTPYVVIIIFMMLIDNVFIKAEELMLEEKFGSSWLEYKRKARRWI